VWTVKVAGGYRVLRGGADWFDAALPSLLAGRDLPPLVYRVQGPFPQVGRQENMPDCNRARHFPRAYTVHAGHDPQHPVVSGTAPEARG
jgi:hypothetical protein